MKILNQSFISKLIVLSLILCPMISDGQTTQKTIAEPEYIGDIIYLDGEKGIPLEKQKASSKAKAGASMYLVGAGKVQSTNIVEGLQSPIRITDRGNVQFVIRYTDNNVDPFQVINVFKMEQNPKKDYRYVEVGSAATFKGSSTMEIDFLAFDVKKYGASSYLIQFSNPIEPGEYAITIEGSRDVFKLFGVD